MLVCPRCGVVSRSDANSAQNRFKRVQFSSVHLPNRVGCRSVQFSSWHGEKRLRSVQFSSFSSVHELFRPCKVPVYGGPPLAGGELVAFYQNVSIALKETFSCWTRYTYFWLAALTTTQPSSSVLSRSQVFFQAPMIRQQAV